MFKIRSASRWLLALCPVWLSACAITAPEPPDLASRDAALGRWTHCLQQFTDHYQGGIRSMQRRANVHCDGHKRDVLATFPLHLENQVDELLSHHSMKMTTARFVKAGAAESWIGLQDSQMDTFRGRLKKTQQADL